VAARQAPSPGVVAAHQHAPGLETRGDRQGTLCEPTAVRNDAPGRAAATPAIGLGTPEISFDIRDHLLIELPPRVPVLAAGAILVAQVSANGPVANTQLLREILRCLFHDLTVTNRCDVCLARVARLCQAQHMTVLGLDSCKTGWIAVAIDDNGYVDAFIAPNIAEAEAVGRERWDVTTIVVDIPIGLPDSGPRVADIEARKFIKPRHNSVFSTPVRPAVSAATYDEARTASIAFTGGKSLSKQAWAITEKIRDVDRHIASATARILEGHPEVSFRAIAGSPIEHYKKSLPGAMMRRELLASEGIDLPIDLGSGLKGAATDDVHDAAAMAWTARRVERGESDRFPSMDRAERFSDGIDSAIWF